MSFADLALAIAAQLHPGAEKWARRSIITTAEVIERAGLTELDLAVTLVWERFESDFGLALAGRRWDPRAFGILQMRDRPELERDVEGSVKAWLALRANGARDCGEGLPALAWLSSGHCDRGLSLSAKRFTLAVSTLDEVQPKD